MTLTEIEYGSLASSATLNSNFQHLQNEITNLSSQITSETSSFSSTVATLNSSVTNLLSYRDSFIPTGAIIPFQSTQIPEGFLLCDGSEVLISEYQDLYDVIGTTYGHTDSTSFCIPDLQDRTLWGSSSNNETGTYLDAGLPNITGSEQTSERRGNYTASGAFTLSSTGFGWGADGYGDGVKINFDASLSNPIYGNADTVQPPAVVTSFIIKY